MAVTIAVGGAGMALSVKGRFENGVAQPVEPVQGREGEPVIITFLGDEQREDAPADGWEALTRLVESCAVETGIHDLAHEHDHYLHGKPKKS